MLDSLYLNKKGVGKAFNGAMHVTRIYWERLFYHKRPKWPS